jgi:hypothetical protein
MLSGGSGATSGKHTPVPRIPPDVAALIVCE